jgi:hypothetical protein
MINGVVGYFDLYSGYRDSINRAQNAAPNEISVWRQLVIYGCCVVGVVAGPYIPSVLSGTAPDLSSAFSDANRLFWSLIIALAVLPGVYKLIFNPGFPIFVQCGFSLVSGFVSQKIVPIVIGLILKP